MKKCVVLMLALHLSVTVASGQETEVRYENHSAENEKTEQVADKKSSAEGYQKSFSKAKSDRESPFKDNQKSFSNAGRKSFSEDNQKSPSKDDKMTEESLILSYFSPEDFDEETWQSVYETLVGLYRNPININAATREDLQQLPFLTNQQIEDIQYYIFRYGKMKSTAELMMIPSLGYETREFLLNFIYVGSEEERFFPKIKDLAKYGTHEVVATVDIPMYERKGIENGNYLGDKFKHSLRYRFNYGNDVMFGFTGAKDAGEPFFHENKWGYDHYNYYLLIRNYKSLKTFALGCYKVGFGMGLVVDNGMNFGKLSVLSSLGRGSGGNNIRAHSSLSESNYFNGVAATVELWQDLRMSVFLSNRNIDATLKKGDSTAIQTIVTDGYHRTQTEFNKKGNTNEKTVGGNVSYRHKDVYVGATAIYSHLDKTLLPDTTGNGYKKHYPCGNDFFNIGVDYGVTVKNFSFGGETAMNKDGALATINRLTYSSSYKLKLMLLQRYYAYKYTSLHSSAFSDCGRVQNENGVFVGAEWEPSASWHVTAYSDWFYFPWQRYEISDASHGTDNLVQAEFKRKTYKLQMRYRLKIKEKDSKADGGLANEVTQRARLSATYGMQSPLTLKTEADGCLVNFDERDWGYMFSQSADYTIGRSFKTSAMVGYFRSSSYDGRLYVYEKNLLYDFYYPSFYGDGLRMSLLAKYAYKNTLTVAAKLGMTKYFDKDVISSGNQQINSSTQTDLEVQLVLKI